MTDETRNTMAAAAALAAELVAQGIHLRVEDGGLRFDAPAGAFDAALKARVREARADLMQLLAGPVAAPLSSGQERMWFLNRLDDGGAGYTEHLAFRFDGPLDRVALSRALALIVARHPALRTRFRDGADGPEQVIEPPRPFDLPILDLTGRPEALDAELDKAAHRPVDLAVDPHVRFELITLGPDRAVLSVSAHHAAWDGWSNGLFIDEVQTAYAAYVQGTPPVLSVLDTSPADMARRQRQRRLNGDDQPAVAVLRRMLAGFPTQLDLPADHPRPAVADGRGAARAMRIPPELARPFVETARRHRATPYMALLAAFGLLLGRLTGTGRLLIGAPVAARRGAAEEAVIGYLSNTVAIPIELEGAATFAALVDRVRSAVLAVMETQHVPFEQVVEALSPPRSRDRAPLVQAMFALQPATVLPPRLPGIVSAVLTRHNEAARFDLMLNLEPTAEGGFAGPLTYAASLFDAATIDAWAERFLELLRTLPAAWDAPLDLTPRHRVAPEATADAAPIRQPLATPTETRLAALWAEFLTVRSIGRDDDFFMLGGHSLMLMRVVNRIAETGLGRIGLAEAMTATRLSQMAALLDGPTLPASAAADDIAPASEAEEGLWLIRRDQPQAATWNVPVLFPLDPPASPETVRAALTALLARHPALRTTLFERDGAILRRVAAATAVEATLLTALDRPARAAALRAELARPIDLERGPICRFTMFGGATGVEAVFLVADHAVIDGWSVEVLRRDLAALLKAADSLPPPATTPAERLARRAEDLAGARGAVLRRYWLSTLEGMELGPLPGAAIRPAGQEPQGRRVTGALSAEALDALERMARAGGTTATVALAAAVGALLIRLKGDGHDVSVAMPFADRPTLDDAELVGCLANVLPLRLSGSWSRSFAEHLADTRQAVAGAVAHQDYPFRRIVADLLAARGTQAALFDAVVVLEEPDPAAADWSDSQLGAGKYDLAFMVGRLGPGRATLSVEYDAALYDEVAAQALARRLDTLIVDAARRMDAELGDLTILPAAEWALVTETFAGTLEDYPRDASLADLWRAAAARHGDRPALLDHGRTTSYAALAARAESIAAGLRTGGLKGGVVGHAFARGADAVAAILGTLLAGAAYLPLDSRMPPALVRTLLADAGAGLILADPANAGRLAAIEGITVRPLAAIEAAGRSLAPIAPTTDGGSVAYIMFTSGSTGTPKGVMVTHRGVARLAFGATRWPVQPGDRIPQIAPLGFDASTLEIWCTLLNGGQLLVLGDEEILDPQAMGAALRRDGASGMWLTAGLFNRVAEDNPAALAGLRFVHTGGEIVSPPHLRRVMDACPDTALYNGYGPTENGVFTAIHPIARADLDGAVPIGRPVTGTRVHVLDERLHLVPVGIWGELCTAGDGVALGYAGRPDLTAAAFQALPWKPEERVYRTGDIARWRGDGVLEFAGRRDGQVKIRGQRIETGAIETVLSTIDGVRDAAVVVVGSGAERVLAACVAAAEDREDSWRRRIAAELPSYMMPALFLRLEALPVTANGKCDRRALAALAEAQVTVPAGAPQPLTGAEALVARLFGELFPGRTIGADADFVRLGGHSLMAMRLAHRLEEETGRRVTLRALLAAATVSAIAALLPEAQDDDHAIPRAPDTADHPLSGGQERLWVMQRLFPHMAVYNVPMVFDVTGAFDDAAFARALGALEERHHALRLRVVSADTGVRQRLAPAGSLVPQMIDLTTAADPTAAAAERMATELARPFRLEAEAGARAFMMRLDARTRRILLVLHHGVCDGWSMGVLVRDLAALYAAETTGAAPALPPPGRQAEDVAVWQRGLVDSAEGKAALARWTERLSPPPVPLDLPADRPRPPTRSYRGGIRLLSFDAADSAALDRLAQANSVTPFMLLLALTQVLLHRLSGQPDLALGTLVAGRDRAELRDTVGFLVNTLVLRRVIDPAQPFRLHLEATRTQCLQAIADQNCPFEALVEAVGSKRDLGRNPLFDILVVWQDEEAPPPDLAGLTTTPVAIDFPFAKFDLGFHFGRRDGAIVCQLEFSRDLFDDDTVDALLARLVTLARHTTADPERPLCDLDILPAEERALVVDGFNATATPHDCRRVISRLVLDRVAAAPDLPAILGDGTLSYRDFAGRAGRVARRLVEAGVRPGEVVAVCLPRSADMVVAIHGILMAGAAYAPLAADQPAARLAGMLDDLACPVVLADAGTRALVVGNGRRVLDACDGLADEPLCLGEPDGLAYVIFTSGSTGRPKGVAVEHHSVLNRIQWMQRAFPIGPGDVILQKTPVTFDVSVWELFWWSWTGAAVAVPPPGLERDPAGLVEFIARQGVTVMHFVPSMLAAFLTHLESGRADLARLRRLRYVFASGEALDAGLAERFDRLLHRPFGTELHNLYGPTEATVDVTWQPCSPWTGGEVVPIGRPIDNVRLLILDDAGRPVPVGVAGEIHIGGVQVARGYVNRPDLTAERFITDPVTDGGRLYRTGDLGRWRRDGRVEYLGRSDFQVKVRGQRIEPGEVEHVLEQHPAVERALVVPATVQGLTELHAYLLAAPTLDSAAVRAYLRDRLPEAMVPARLFRLATLPLTSSGKVDRKALSGTPLDARPAAVVAAPSGEALEGEILAIWRALLPEAELGRHVGFFDAGGNSLLAIRLQERFDQRWPGVFTVTDLFACATIAEQARRIGEVEQIEKALPLAPLKALPLDGEGFPDTIPIAVVGLAVRLPGADDLAGFWDDVAAGADRVGPLPAERQADARSLIAALGLPQPERFRDAAWIDDLYGFAPRRLRMSPADAALIDPEQRLFLEVGLRALEDAGRGGAALDDARVGVFVGVSLGTSWRDAVMRVVPPAKVEQAFALNVPSNVATRLSFLHNWRGPAALVDTACSSSLTAVHLACRALRSGECDWALVGGAKAILLPPGDGQRLTIDSSNGRTRAFAEGADGTGMGEGAVALLLRPLDRALAEGDPIHAVILGSAVNQDGASSGMAAPNPAAQAEVIRAAARDAGVSLGSVSYVEAHGTGTALGDPIEIDGLTRAFAAETADRGFAFIGSAKGNYGHLDGAAGALGMARAVLALKHDRAPPQPFFTQPSSRIDFARAPVTVAAGAPAVLPDRGGPRRAGVSAFGLSGINAHVLLEAAAAPQPRDETIPGWLTVGLSAPDEAALRRYAAALVTAMRADPALSLASIARTLTDGRDTLDVRLAVWVRDRGDLMARLAVFAVAPEAVAELVVNGTADRAAAAEIRPAVHDDEAAAQAAARAFVAGAGLRWPDSLTGRRAHLPAAPLVRRRCAADFSAVATPAPPQPTGRLLGPVVETPQGRFAAVDVHDPGFWPVAEHLLAGEPTLVGMAFPALLAEMVGQRPLTIEDLRWLRPLRLSAVERGSVGLSLTPGATAGAFKAELSGRTADGRWLAFVQATLAAASPSPEPVDLAALIALCGPGTEAAPFAGGSGIVQVSPRWDCLRRVAQRPDQAIAWLSRPTGETLHPGLLDVATSIALDRNGLVPAGCGRIVVAGTLPDDPVVVVRRRPSADGMEADATIVSAADGRVAVAFHDLRFVAVTPVAAPAVAPRADIIASVPVWRAAPLSVNDPGGSLLLIGEGPWADRLAAHLSASGRLAGYTGSAAPDAAVLDRLSDGSLAGVILAAASGPDMGSRIPALVRRIMTTKRSTLRLLAITEGAYAVGHDGPLEPDQAITAGILQVAIREDTSFQARAVDAEAGTPLDGLLAELAVPPTVPAAAVAWRHGRRLVRAFEPAPTGGAACWPESGCCVVTGGTGGLTLHLAETLTNQGRVALALISRSGEPTGDQSDAGLRRERLAALRAAGYRVQVHACDVTDRAALAETLARIRTEQGPITAIVHNAGIAGDGALAGDVPLESLARGIAVKVDGARALDALTRDDPVRAFVLAGSLTGLIGAISHAAYTAGNAFLDSFAAQRRREGRPGLAIDWCAIAEMGMAARLYHGRPRIDVTLSQAETVALWHTALSIDAGQVALLDPAVRAMLDAPAGLTAPSPRRGRALEAALAVVWAEVLGYDAVAPEDDFYALGGDSIAGMQIVDKVRHDLGHGLSLNDVLDAGSVRRLAERLLSDSDASPDVSTTIPVAEPQAVYPVAWEQLDVLQAEAADERGTAYNLPMGVWFPPGMDVERLRRTVDTLVARYEILRTRFRFADDAEPVMEILPPAPVLFETAEADPTAPEPFLDWVRPFNLHDGVPVRFALTPEGASPGALVFDVHHALADAFTMERLQAELAALYAGSAGEPPARQLKDYAWWSRQGAGAVSAEAALTYWKGVYTGEPPVLDLPADRPRPARHTWRNGVTGVDIPFDTVRGLRRCAAERRTTPFVIMLTAWSILLHRYARTDDVVIAVPIDGRDAAGVAGMAGMMVSLLPLRLGVSEADTLGGLIERVQGRHAEALRHRACTVGRILSELALPAAPDRTRLSEVSLSYMNFAEGGGLDGGGGLEPFSLLRGDVKNDLSIYVRDLPDSMSIVLEYYADLFDAERMERMGRHFRTLLTALVAAAPDVPIGRLPLLDDEEETWLAGVETGASVPLPAGLFAMLRAHVQTTPEAPALDDGRTRLTYAQLLAHAQGVAQALSEAGVAPGDRVAFHMERGAAAVVAVVGLAAAGVVAVALDPAWPTERLRWILDDAAVAVVIADDAGRAALDGAGRRLLAADDLAARVSDRAAEPPADIPVHIMYTSGSTGLPKGVVVPQRAVLRLALGDDYVRLSPRDRVMQAGPLAFDASTFEIWGALLNGACVCVVGRDETLDPQDFARALIERRGSVLWMTAGLFNRQVDALPDSFRSLRAVLTGGEVLSPSHLRRAMAANPDTVFFNGYGPTENVTFTAVRRIEPADVAPGPVPLGRPIPNTLVAVLDPDGRRTPVGLWGEIVTGGAGLADGYLGRPDLTAERFITDPHHAGGRLYRTGDLGRWRRDGVLEFGGRLDGQIKLRGFRIELEEIEHVLAAHPAVAAAAVLFQTGEDGDGEIIACVEPAGDPAELRGLRGWLGKRLPTYMVPRRVVVVAALPVNANGKVDRARLASALPPADHDEIAAPSGEPPRDEAERLVAQVFAEVFGRPVNDRQASFMDLGGHSLLAIKVVNRIAQLAGARLTMRAFFADPTVAALARLIGPGAQGDETIPRIPDAPSYPASHAQARLFLAHDLDPNRNAYNITSLLCCGDDFDPAALRIALERLSRRHETLRTAFHEDGGMIRQSVHEDARPEVALEDVSALPSPLDEVLRLARREAATPFDLARAPLLRARAVRIDRETWVVLLVLHHIVGDGWSMRLFSQELAALYDEARGGPAAGLPPLPIAYRDFAAWQAGRDWTDAAAYWRETLAGAAERIALPADRTVSGVASHRGDTVVRTLPASLAEGLAAFARQRGVTVATVGLALFAALLYRLTRQRDMTLGMGVAGRDHAQVEGLIGFFVNILPIRLHVDDDTEIETLVAQVNAAVLEAMDHRDYPFDLLVRAVAPRRSGAQQPLANVVYEYQRFDDLEARPAAGLGTTPAGLDPGFLTAMEQAIHTPTAKHDLLLFFADGRDGAVLRLEYDSDLFDRTTAERWLAFYEQFAALVVTQADSFSHSKDAAE